MEKDLVSVIIPVYNSEKYIENTLKSVMNQTYKNLEVIVIDDKSTDNSLKIIEKFSNIKIIKNATNKGLVYSRNLGIRNAKGEFIAFLDSDDIWYNKKIEKQIKYFKNNDRLGLVSCGFKLIYNNEKSIKYIPQNYTKEELIKKLYINNIISNGSCAIVRNDVFDKVGMFDPDMPVAEDWDMWTRILKEYDIGFVEDVLVDVIVRKDSLSSSKNADKMLKYDLKYLDKHREFYLQYLSRFQYRRGYARRYISNAYSNIELKKYNKAFLSCLKVIYYYPLYLFDKRFISYFIKILLKK